MRCTGEGFFVEPPKKTKQSLFFRELLSNPDFTTAVPALQSTSDWQLAPEYARASHRPGWPTPYESSDHIGSKFCLISIW